MTTLYSFVFTTSVQFNQYHPESYQESTYVVEMNAYISRKATMSFSFSPPLSTGPILMKNMPRRQISPSSENRSLEVLD